MPTKKKVKYYVEDVTIYLIIFCHCEILPTNSIKIFFHSQKEKKHVLSTNPIIVILWLYDNQYIINKIETSHDMMSEKPCWLSRLLF